MYAYPNPMFHWDIRWPNIAQQTDILEKWFLIDWDDAALAPTRMNLDLSPGYHAPAVFKDGHGAEVDLWAVGKLIEEADGFVGPSESL